MGKITTDFKEKITKQAETSFAIIVTTKGGEEIQHAGLKPIAGLDNCLVGTLTGSRILELTKNKQVVAIEPDVEMQILDPE
jgi:hypothetical protein